MSQTYPHAIKFAQEPILNQERPGYFVLRKAKIRFDLIIFAKCFYADLIFIVGHLLTKKSDKIGLLKCFKFA